MQDMTRDQLQAAHHFGVDPARVHIDNVTYKTFVRLHDITPEEFTQLAPKCDDQYHLSRLKPGERLRMGCDPSREDTWDALYRLYVKQSLSFETICDLLDLKKLDVVKALEKEMDDDELNKVLQATYSKVALAGKTNVAERIAEQLKLDFTKPEQTEPRGIGLADPVPPIMVKCPACEGVGWTVLFVVRRDCKFCEATGEVDAGKWLEYEEDKPDAS
jgi:hypothetical protein